MQFRWNLWQMKRGGPYVRTTICVDEKKTTIRLHTLITGYPQTDHIDRDGLNNQRYNLRPATNQQNTANRASVGGSSAHKGVYWHRAERKWAVSIYREGRQRTIGYFADEEDAARAYDAAATVVQGEFACLNFPPVVSEGAAARRQAERDAFASQREAYQAMALANVPTTQAEWWARKQSVECVCTSCGVTYLSKSQRVSYSCSVRCQGRRARQLAQERRALKLAD